MIKEIFSVKKIFFIISFLQQFRQCGRTLKHAVNTLAESLIISRDFIFTAQDGVMAISADLSPKTCLTNHHIK